MNTGWMELGLSMVCPFAVLLMVLLTKGKFEAEHREIEPGRRQLAWKLWVFTAVASVVCAFSNWSFANRREISMSSQREVERLMQRSQHADTTNMVHMLVQAQATNVFLLTGIKLSIPKVFTPETIAAFGARAEAASASMRQSTVASSNHSALVDLVFQSVAQGFEGLSNQLVLEFSDMKQRLPSSTNAPRDFSEAMAMMRTMLTGVEERERGASNSLALLQIGIEKLIAGERMRYVHEQFHPLLEFLRSNPGMQNSTIFANAIRIENELIRYAPIPNEPNAQIPPRPPPPRISPD